MDEKDQMIQSIPAIERLEVFSQSVSSYVKQYEKASDNASKAVIWNLLRRALDLESEAKKEVVNNYRRTFLIASLRKQGELIDTDFINTYFVK